MCHAIIIIHGIIILSMCMQNITSFLLSRDIRVNQILTQLFILINHVKVYWLWNCRKLFDLYEVWSQESYSFSCGNTVISNHFTRQSTLLKVSVNTWLLLLTSQTSNLSAATRSRIEWLSRMYLIKINNSTHYVTFLWKEIFQQHYMKALMHV